MKINGNDISGSNGELPTGSLHTDGFQKWENIIKSINELLTNYQKLKGITPTPSVMPNQANHPLPATPQINSEHILEFLLSTCQKLEGEGKGNEPIGKVISEANTSVSECRQGINLLLQQLKLQG